MSDEKYYIQRMDYEKAHQYLTDLKMIFDNAKIPFILFFGTLLGACRERDFIKHDTHVDVAIFGRDINKVMSVRPKFEKLGYRFSPCINLKSSNKPTQVIISRVENEVMKIDVYTLFLFRAVRWYVRYIRTRLALIPELKVDKEMREHSVPFHLKFFKQLRTIKFRGQEYLTPGPEPHSILDYLWGFNKWKIRGLGQVGNQPLAVWFKMGELIDEENE